MLLGRLEELGAIVEGLDQVEARDIRAGDQPDQTLPAVGKRQRPEILPVTVQQVEGEEDARALGPPVWRTADR